MENVLKVKAAEQISKMTQEEVIKVLLFMAGLEEADAKGCFEKRGYEPEAGVR